MQETFERAKAWVKELQRQASPNIVIALAGNKADLSEKRLVEYEVTHSCAALCSGVFEGVFFLVSITVDVKEFSVYMDCLDLS